MRGLIGKYEESEEGRDEEGRREIIAFPRKIGVGIAANYLGIPQERCQTAYRRSALDFACGYFTFSSRLRTRIC
jgi:hypothetical protein